MEQEFDELELFDINGRVLRHVINPGHSIEFDLQNEATGVYFVRFILEGKTWVERASVVK